jgi:hypothetical protein
MVSPPLSSAANLVRHPDGLLSDHSTADHWPPASRIFTGTPLVLTWEKATPGAALGQMTEVGRASPVRMGREL